jgi:hypothetical protein
MEFCVKCRSFILKKCWDIWELVWLLLRGKLAKVITFWKCHLWWWRVNSKFHTCCETTSCLERAPNLQSDDLGYRSGFVLISSVILERYLLLFSLGSIFSLTHFLNCYMNSYLSQRNWGNKCSALYCDVL